MNILEEFWYGNINPQEQSKDNNRAIKELLNLVGCNCINECVLSPKKRGRLPSLF